MSADIRDLDQAPLSSERAKALYGAHWLYAADGSVVEILGPADPEHPHAFPSLPEAIQMAQRLRRKNAAQEVERSLRILRKRRTKILAWLAGLGLHPRSELIRNNVAKLRQSLEQQTAVLAGVDDWKPECKRLPETLALPVVLDLGRPVWKVDYSWPLTDGVRISKLQVESRTLHRCSDLLRREPWDYEFIYLCGQGDRRMTFRYRHANMDNSEIQGLTLHATRLFLTPAAAEACVRDVASRLRARADEALDSISKLDEL